MFDIGQSQFVPNMPTDIGGHEALHRVIMDVKQHGSTDQGPSSPANLTH